MLEEYIDDMINQNEWMGKYQEEWYVFGCAGKFSTRIWPLPIENPWNAAWYNEYPNPAHPFWIWGGSGWGIMPLFPARLYQQIVRQGVSGVAFEAGHCLRRCQGVENGFLYRLRRAEHQRVEAEFG
jgi:hypothetical protein